MKTSPNYRLSNLISSQIRGKISRSFIFTSDLSFPSELNGYRYVRTLLKHGPKKSYTLGLYSHPLNGFAFAKMCSAKVKDYHYYSLYNEAVVSRTLNDVVRRLGSKIPTQFKKIFIPKFYGMYENSEYLVILSEYVKARPTAGFSTSRKVSTYFLVSDFLTYLGKAMTAGERANLSSRTPLQLLLFFSITSVTTLIHYPGQFGKLFKSWWLIITGYPVTAKNGHLSLIHRDLHFQNILFRDNKLFLIDLQQCVFGLELQEYVTTLRYFWYTGGFYKLFFKEILTRFTKTRDFKKEFQFLSLTSVVHGLTDTGFPRGTINRWIKFWDFFLSNTYPSNLQTYA